MRAARARSSKQNTRANISAFCLQIWPSIKSRAINCFNKCVFGFYSHWKVWYKSEKAFGMCSEWHYTTRGLAYGDIRQSPSLCNAILNTCPCLLAIYIYVKHSSFSTQIRNMILRMHNKMFLQTLVCCTKAVVERRSTIQSTEMGFGKAINETRYSV